MVETWLIAESSDGYMYGAKMIQGNSEDLTRYLALYKPTHPGVRIISKSPVVISKTALNTLEDLVAEKKDLQTDAVRISLRQKGIEEGLKRLGL